MNLFILTQCHENITFHREIVYLMSTTESHIFRITKTNGANLHYKQEKKKNVMHEVVVNLFVDAYITDC